MITRDQLSITNDDDIWKLIEQEREQYQELVDAAVAAYKELEFRGHGFSNNSTGKKLDEAIKPFLEPQSIADELDALASDLYDSGRHLWERKLRELADRYRELHGEGRDE